MVGALSAAPASAEEPALALELELPLSFSPSPASPVSLESHSSFQPWLARFPQPPPGFFFQAFQPLSFFQSLLSQASFR